MNQKGLAFHVEARQKNYKEEKKLRKSYEVPSLFSLKLVSFYSFFAPRILGNFSGLDFNSFSIFNFS